MALKKKISDLLAVCKSYSIEHVNGSLTWKIIIFILPILIQILPCLLSETGHISTTIGHF